MSDAVVLAHRNVCKEGFTVENAADAGEIAALRLHTWAH